MKICYKLLLLSILSFVLSCSSDNDSFPDEGEEVSPVVFDLSAMPYPKLSDYNFFKMPLADVDPVYGVIPYEPISNLFSDYAHKKRFIWMPEGVSATYTSDSEPLDFPVGTVIIKTFYYEHVLPSDSEKLLET